MIACVRNIALRQTARDIAVIVIALVFIGARVGARGSLKRISSKYERAAHNGCTHGFGRSPQMGHDGLGWARMG